MDILNIKESDIFKAISEDIRLRIMVLLSEGELCVCDLMQAFELPQSSVSRHMAKLKSSQLVIDRRDGKWVYYSINEQINRYIPFLTANFKTLRDRQPYQTDREKLQRHFSTKSCESDKNI